jgi:hypothetical protein
MNIEKYVSPFIESQFPLFYKEEGPVFIEFAKAYYEWMEQTGNITNLSRSLLENRDIDTTLANYVTYFKNKYINSLPENIIADKKLLIKHILELYRSKGSETSYRLLFKMIFNEDIETYTPSKYIFKASDGEWVSPKYIEVSDNKHFPALIGNKIYSSASIASAIVENYYTTAVNDKLVNVLVLSNLEGNFKYGERVLCDNLYVKRVYNNNYYKTTSSFTGVLNYDTLTVSNVVGTILIGQTVYVGESKLGTIIAGSGTVWEVNVKGYLDSSPMSSSFNIDETLTNDYINYHKYSKLSSVDQSNYVLAIDEVNAPIIFGSLSSVSIVNGGLGYNVGDLLDIKNSGVGGVARVKATTTKNGEVTFNLISGGTGFTLDASVEVDGRSIAIKNATQTNPVVVETNDNHELSDSVSIRIDFVQGMDDLNVKSYSYFVKVLTDKTFSIYSDISLSTTVDGTSFGPYLANTGYVYVNTGQTQEATFKIGSLVNKEIYNINLDHVHDYFYTVLDDVVEGYGINISGTSGTFSSGHTVTMDPVDVLSFDCTVASIETILANNEILSNTSLGITDLTVVNGNETYVQVKGSDINNANLVPGTVLISDVSETVIIINTIFPVKSISGSATLNLVNSNRLQACNQVGYFISGEQIKDTTSLATATITSVDRLTDWNTLGIGLPEGVLKNLDTGINILQWKELEVGTIASITNINPGRGYSVDPVVSIVEPLIYDLDITEQTGPYVGTRKGFNSVVTAKAGIADGIVAAIDVIDSGFGYDRDQQVELLSKTNPYAVTGTTVIDLNGKAKGYWKDNKSFISDKMYLQDSYFYQKYSYQIIAPRMLNTYENLVKNLVHPTGILLFGKYVIKHEFDIEFSTLADHDFVYTAYVPVYVDSTNVRTDDILITADRY